MRLAGITQEPLKSVILTLAAFGFKKIPANRRFDTAFWKIVQNQKMSIDAENVQMIILPKKTETRCAAATGLSFWKKGNGFLVDSFK
ncbi:hypothetical protein DQG23_04680 [Paenibacillus contaminans]|uniref:Uncharacterized protein n=1 Tax=Paenibacillus contaminans TaxID=450362 RepID=A0A329MRR8_9BACL|nr:hypothetical protein DQG23_04680 [Paenibacillus contaminans]